MTAPSIAAFRADGCRATATGNHARFSDSMRLVVLLLLRVETEDLLEGATATTPLAARVKDSSTREGGIAGGGGAGDGERSSTLESDGEGDSMDADDEEEDEMPLRSTLTGGVCERNGAAIRRSEGADVATFVDNGTGVVSDAFTMDDESECLPRGREGEEGEGEGTREDDGAVITL